LIDNDDIIQKRKTNQGAYDGKLWIHGSTQCVRWSTGCMLFGDCNFLKDPDGWIPCLLKRKLDVVVTWMLGSESGWIAKCMHTKILWRIAVENEHKKKRSFSRFSVQIANTESESSALVTHNQVVHGDK